MTARGGDHAETTLFISHHGKFKGSFHPYGNSGQGGIVSVDHHPGNLDRILRLQTRPDKQGKQQQQNHAYSDRMFILHNVLILKRSCTAGLAGLTMDIETPRGRASEEFDSVKDFFGVLLAIPAAEPTGNALARIQVSGDDFCM